jgi:hypothetical protein
MTGRVYLKLKRFTDTRRNRTGTDYTRANGVNETESRAEIGSNRSDL